jgi:hypothetical protein
LDNKIYYKGLSSTDYEAIEYFKKMDQNQKFFTSKNISDNKAIDVTFDQTNVEA